MPARQRPSRRREKETPQAKRARAKALADRLAQLYPEVECPLTHRNTFELLVAVILSAQCTDAAVNKVTPTLFRRFPDARSLSQTDPEEIEPLIRSLGLYRAKARALKRCARQLVEEFNGAVPNSMAELTRLAGVGRKTANVILGHAFHMTGIAVDTHCKRLSRRLGLSGEGDPKKIEQDLAALLPPSQWTGFSHRLILHGRRVCHARKPSCENCPLSDLCPSSTAQGSAL